MKLNASKIFKSSQFLKCFWMHLCVHVEEMIGGGGILGMGVFLHAVNNIPVTECDNSLRGMNILSRFSVMFDKGDNFVTSCLLLCSPIRFRKGVYPKRKKKCSQWEANSFLFE